jgi:hypothetical protein
MPAYIQWKRPLERVVLGLMIASFMLLSLGIWRDATADQEALGASLTLTFQADQLSVQSQQATLRQVLAELARQGNLTIRLPLSEAEDKISVSFHHLSLTEGIKRLLKSKSYVLITTPAPEIHRGHKVTAIHVLSTSAGSSMTLMANSENAVEDKQSTQPPQALDALDPETRVAALQAATLQALKNDEGIVPTLVQALRDEVPQVREAALWLLGSIENEEMPYEAITQIALTDPSARLRAVALGRLDATDAELAQETLQQALQDPDPEIRTMAEQLLARARQDAESPLQEPSTVESVGGAAKVSD